MLKKNYFDLKKEPINRLIEALQKDACGNEVEESFVNHLLYAINTIKSYYAFPDDVGEKILLYDLDACVPSVEEMFFARINQALYSVKITICQEHSGYSLRSKFIRDNNGSKDCIEYRWHLGLPWD